MTTIYSGSNNLNHTTAIALPSDRSKHSKSDLRKKDMSKKVRFEQEYGTVQTLHSNMDQINDDAIQQMEEVFNSNMSRSQQKSSAVVAAHTLHPSIYDVENGFNSSKPIHVEGQHTVLPSVASLTPDPPETDHIKVRKATEKLNQQYLWCECCRIASSIGYIAAYVKIRTLGLILTSFVPPLIEIKYEKSWRFPDGHSYITTYFENKTLVWLFIVNIIFCFFLLCYGMSTYYTWFISQSDLYSDPYDKRIYEKMPQTHHFYILYVAIQVTILVVIDSMDLPENIIIFKPNYYSLFASLLLEFAILHLVKTYVQISYDKIDTIKKELMELERQLELEQSEHDESNR